MVGVTLSHSSVTAISVSEMLVLSSSLPMSAYSDLSDTYSEHCQISKMVHFTEIFKGWKPSTVIQKTLYVWEAFEHASACSNFFTIGLIILSKVGINFGNSICLLGRKIAVQGKAALLISFPWELPKRLKAKKLINPIQFRKAHRFPLI